MKTFLIRNGLLLSMTAIFIAIFAIGGLFSNYMSEQLSTHLVTTTPTTDPGEQNAAFQAFFPGSDRVEEFTSVAASKNVTLFNRAETFDLTVAKSYRILNGTVELGVIYVINSYGKHPGLQVAYAIEVATDRCIGLVVLANAETPSFYASLTATFFDQFDNLPFNDLALAVDAVGGATYSSKGFEMGLLYAREAYAADFGFVIPTVNLTIVHLDYNYDPATFVASPYVADIVYGDGDTAASVYLSASFDYVGLVGGGTDLPADLQAGLKTAASADGSVSGTAYFVSYDSQARELIIETKGFRPEDPIAVTITINATLDGVASFSVDSHETYDEDDNSIEEYGIYDGAGVPAVENHFMTQYQTTGVITIDAVAGASQGTSPAMLALLRLLDGFINDLNGGH